MESKMVEISDTHTRVTSMLAQSARAVELRKAGLSNRAIANATGLQLREVREYCKGVSPTVKLPDLPGMPSLRETHPDVIAKMRRLWAERRTVSDIVRITGVCAATVRGYVTTPGDLVARAVNLRMRGLSPLAVANAMGVSYEVALEACEGVVPRITLPDLPGVKPPSDITQRKHPAALSDDVVAQIRQMRADRYSRANIARALGVSVATVSNYAPIGPNTRSAGSDARAKVTPELHREIRRLRLAEHLSYDKIAAKTGLSALTVRRYAKMEPQ